MRLQSPKLAALEERLAQAEAKSRTNQAVNKVALGRLKETIIRGITTYAEDDLDADTVGIPSIHDASDEKGPINGSRGRRATVFLNPQKLEDSRLFKLDLDSGFLRRAAESEDE